jgi:multimeric flavodoxin WrbA
VLIHKGINVKITILNGSPQREVLDQYLDALVQTLMDKGHQVSQLALRDLSLKYCIGCFDCWTKTPGICEADQASQDMDREIINSDFTLWAAPLKMGFPSALMKMAFDKHLPLIHPYMVVDQGEAHHLKRYKSYPRVGLLIEEELDTTEVDLIILRDLFSRTALNFKSKLEFMETTRGKVEDLAGQIERPRRGRHLYARKLLPVLGGKIDPPKSLTLFNGSPRGKKGNTPIMLEQLREGFAGESKLHHLVFTNNLTEQVEAFQEAECVWLGFPLYTDGMPGLVKTFLEALEPLKGQENNPPIGFLVQSGFPEGLHSRYVERYLARLTEKLGSPYLGTIVKGNGEGTRIRSAEGNQPLFENLLSLGRELRENGQLDPDILLDTAKPERYPLILAPIFKIILKMKSSHSYFDSMLIENQAYERRNDTPFLD